MSNFREQHPDYEKPATKGDVIGAMVYTEALALKTVMLALAAGSPEAGRKEAIATAYQAFAQELSEYQAKRVSIGGGPADE